MQSKSLSLFFILLAGLLMAACSQKDHLVTIKTRYGDMKMILYDETPKHKANFLKLAKEGRYDSTVFHRVIEGFMIQGGDVNIGVDESEQIAYTIPAELNDSLIHEKGAVAAARLGDAQNPEKASSGSQFYIIQGKKYSPGELRQMTDGQYQYELQRLFGQLLRKEEYAALREKVIALQSSGKMDSLMALVAESESLIAEEFGLPDKMQLTDQQIEAYTTVGGTPHLDGGYTVFGKVIDGLPVIDSIAMVQTGPADRPVSDLYMTVEVEEVSRNKISKRYGYDYPEQ